MLLVSSALLGGCLDTDLPDSPSFFTLSLTLEDTNELYVVGNDTLQVIAFKMLIDSIAVKRVNDVPEKFESNPRLAFFVPGPTDVYTIGSGTINEGVFLGIQYSILTPPMDTDLIDSDLIVRDQFGDVTRVFSFSVTGIYNNELFRFRSDRVEQVDYDFYEIINLPQNHASLQALMRGNWKRWFYDPAQNRLINPLSPANRTVIENNILRHFDILTITTGI